MHLIVNWNENGLYRHEHTNTVANMKSKKKYRISSHFRNIPLKKLFLETLWVTAWQWELTPKNVTWFKWEMRGGSYWLKTKIGK